MWGGCRERFSQQKDFSSHVSRHARDSGDKSCQWAECPRRGEKKSNKCTLLTHIRIHTREKPFRCKTCDKEYSRADALSKHTRSHEQMATDESVCSGKMSHLLVLRSEYELLIGSARKAEKKLILENDILLRRIAEKRVQ
jgi:uncharacterized Zn-finger protein